MTELYYKLKIIKIFEKYGKWFYNKTSLYKKYFINGQWKLSLNMKKITDIYHNKTFYDQLKRELEYLAYK